jgi:hypothetical protein
MEAVLKITPLYQLNRRMGGPQSRSGRFREKSLAPAVIRTPDRPARNVSSVPSTMSRLLQRGSSLTYIVDLAR